MAILRDSMSKLDLPGTGEEFAALNRTKGVAAGGSEALKGFYFRASGQATIAANVASISFGKPPVGYYWLVERISVKGAGVGAKATVYVGPVADTNIGDFTDAANEDIADESSPIYVPSTDELIVRITSGVNGNVCTIAIQAKAIPT